ncbi:MAG: PVC-type heme-binding CxxCH protein [Verrucomicrobiales bacterium]
MSLFPSTAVFAQNRDDPGAELASFKMADGFEANLFASEKDGVVKPIQMRFDARGRLWVAGSAVYPQLKPGQEPSDRIIILEDLDRDSRCDKTTVFAEGLMIPTGLEVTGDASGCYIGQGPELIYLRDLDGDGKSDIRETVLRGFGTGDNHQNINSFRFGPGGDLWFCQGLHIYSRVETPWGIEKLDQAGMWRLRPRRLRLAGYYGSAAEPQNPWGFVFTRWGEPLELAGNNHSIIYPVPGLVHNDRPGQPTLIWKSGRSRKMSGGEIVETAHFPDEWQGRLIIGGYLNNAVWALNIRDDGSGFALDDAPPLITSNHASFRPVDVRFGPDGALYLCDWYNPIIGHYQASFRHPERDKTHGRIWRVTAKNRPLTPLPKLPDMSMREIMAKLGAEDGWAREFARRVLADRPTDEMLAAATEWLEGRRTDHELKECLGVLQSHEAVEAGQSVIERLCQAQEAGARAYAASAIGLWADCLPRAIELLRPLASDAHARVRLQAVVACTYVEAAEAIEVAMAAADFPTDKFLDYALDQAVHALKPHWLPHFRAGRLTFGGQPHRLLRFVRGEGTDEMVNLARDLLREGKIESAARQGLWTLLVEAGTPSDLTGVLQLDDQRLLSQLLPVVTRLARNRGLRPDGNILERLRHLLDSPSPIVRDEALRLAGAWKVQELRPVLLEKASTLAGIEGLVALDSAAAAQELTKLLAANSRTAPSLLPVFFQRAGAADLLAQALKSTPPASDAARASRQEMNERGLEHAGLSEVFAQTRSGATPWANAPEFATALAVEVRTDGNPENGALVYKRAELTCVACHSVAGEGGSLGPALDSIGTAQPLDFIIGAVLAPQKEVKESYDAVQVTLKNGEIITGFRSTDNPRELTLRAPAQNNIVVLRREDIAAEKPLGSLMPAGLVDSLTRHELRDLFCYLSTLGKAR